MEQSFNILSEKLKNRSILAIILMILVSIAETLGIALLVPILSTLINPENLDQTMKINLENLQVDINEDGELEFYEAVDPKTIPVWNPRKGGGRTGQKPPLK